METDRNRRRRGEQDMRGLGYYLLESLPEEQRVPLILFAQEGMKYEAIAELMQLPSGTVKSRIARARSRLIEILETEDGNNPAQAPSKRVKGGRKA